jgi:hypothetical protein
MGLNLADQTTPATSFFKKLQNIFSQKKYRQPTVHPVHWRCREGTSLQRRPFIKTTPYPSLHHQCKQTKSKNQSKNTTFHKSNKNKELHLFLPRGSIFLKTLNPPYTISVRKKQHLVNNFFNKDKLRTPRTIRNPLYIYIEEHLFPRVKQLLFNKRTDKRIIKNVLYIE